MFLISIHGSMNFLLLLVLRYSLIGLFMFKEGVPMSVDDNAIYLLTLINETQCQHFFLECPHSFVSILLVMITLYSGRTLGACCYQIQQEWMR